jgi:hypothetical protein
MHASAGNMHVTCIRFRIGDGVLIFLLNY